MAMHGSVSKFQPGKKDWSTYVEQLNFYFIANSVTTDENSTFELRISHVQVDQKLAGRRQDGNYALQGPSRPSAD